MIRKYALCALFSAFLGLGVCTAQTIAGSIVGTVTDPGGAVVPHASVSLTNIGTNVVQKSTTDEDGTFRFLLLPPGAYSILVTASGFKSFRRDGLVVEVDRSLGLPVALEIGQVTEQVLVNGASPLLEPNTSSLGTVMDEQKIIDLPMNGRNPMFLANLVPTVRGVGYFGGQTLSSWRMAAVSIGGGQPLSNGFLIDGIANDKMVDSGPMTFLTVDDTEEFKIQTNAMSAEFGRTSGGVISMISKSGTNDLHGSLFEFLRNQDLNANNFFSNKAGSPIPTDKVNQFGGTVGGRIVKNKLFYFFNYEGYRERAGSVETIISPSVLQRSGNFSNTTISGQPVVIYDPLTTVADPANPGQYIRTPFPGDVIPQSRINPVSQNLLQYFPLPNLPGQGANLFLVGNGPINKDTESFRPDYYITPTQHLAGRFTDDRLKWQITNYFNNIADVDGRLVTIPRRNAFLSYTNAISATVLFDARVGANWQVEAYTTPSQGFDVTKLGMPAALLNQSQPAPGATTPGILPRLTITDLLTTVGGANGGAFGGINAAANHTVTGSSSATLTKIHGAHTWKTGYEFRLYQRNEFSLNYPLGNYTFNRTFTQGPNPLQGSTAGGESVADFLLGTPASGYAGINAASAITLKYDALFFQDDWKVSQKLTLNLGLRWEKEGAPTERHNIFSNFNPNAAVSLQVPGMSLKGGLVYQGVDGYSRALTASSNKNFQPRVGFAYQATPKTVLRGGYGITFVPTTQGTYIGGTGTSVGGTQTGFSSNTPMVTSNNGGLTPANTLSNPFPTGLIAPTGSSLGALTAIGTALSGQLYNVNRGYSQQWNFTTQRQLKDWLLEVAYVGNRGVHLFMANQQLNALPDQDLSLGSALSQLVANPFYGVIKSGPLAAQQVPKAQLLLPYPQFSALPGLQGGVTSPISYLNSSSYNALTVKVEKRFSNGFSVLVSYANSKLLDLGDDLNQVRPGGVVGTYVQDWNNLRLEKAKSLQDVPQRLITTALWEVPLGKAGNPAYRAVAGGWQLNGIATFQSGLPIALSATVVGGGNRPNVVSGVSDKAPQQSINEWFNTAAFTAPAPYTYGNVSRTLADVSSDGTVNLDFSAFKNFTVHEKYKFQFRAEAFNLTNTVTFSTPGTTYGAPTFGVVTATAFSPAARVIQLGLKMQF